MILPLCTIVFHDTTRGFVDDTEEVAVLVHAIDTVEFYAYVTEL
jgi:hypothetical protein